MPRSRACATRGVVLEQPGELARGEVRVQRQARCARGSRPRRPLQAVEHAPASACPARRRPASAAAPVSRVPGEHRLALVVETAGDHLAGRVAPAPRRPRRRPRRAPPRGPARPTPAAGAAIGFPPARLGARGRRSRVEEHRLDRARALVDARAGSGHAHGRERSAASPPPRPVGVPAAAAAGSGPRRRPSRRRVATIPATCSAMPSDARQPGRADRGDVDRPRSRPRAPDRRSSRRGPAGRRPGVGGDRLGPRERRVHPRRRGRASRAAPGRAPTSRPCPRWSTAVGPADDLAVERREDQHALRPRRGHGQQDRVRPRRVEDEELALARVDRERAVAGQSGDLVGAEPGAVDDRAGSARRSPPAACSRGRSTRSRRRGSRCARRAPSAAPRPASASVQATGIGDRTRPGPAGRRRRRVRVDAVAPALRR